MEIFFNDYDPDITESPPLFTFNNSSFIPSYNNDTDAFMGETRDTETGTLK